ncbi:MAG: bifunctional riboflavin kinase/FAD synthetase [Phycisphaerae bacterium]|nr:bifunctional riboflavin kinase/FAD synthetase [Phycisphaerae bacterium]
MRVIRGLEFEPMSGVVLSIGNFDGVHRGHQAILQAGRLKAQAAGTELVAMTFDPHPLTVLTPERMPAVLTPLPEKLRQLERAGADVTVVAESNAGLLQLSATDFIEHVMVRRFRPSAIVEGPSFGFGRHRQGNVETLRAAAARHGFQVQVVEPVRIGLGGHPDAVISSSLVRQLLTAGPVDQAAICLGRPYALLGQVIHGVGRGSGMGFPTANIDPGDQLVPAEGVYAGFGVLGGRRYPAAISIGRTPTFEEHRLVIEAHLLDFNEETYGQALRIEFLQWLRPQVRYDTVGALCQQIAKDVERTRQVCGQHG